MQDRKIPKTNAGKPSWRFQAPGYAVGTVLALVPFHAFLTVWASTVVGHYTLLRLWPEYITLILSMWVVTSRLGVSLWRKVDKLHLAWPISVFFGLNVLYYLWVVLANQVNLQVASYGLLLNTRPIIWFILVIAVAENSAWLQRHWKRLVLIPLVCVSTFALLQFFVLPPNFLAHFGYQTGTTIVPIQTINQDTETIRAQSTLRGPNPLGAYLILGIGLLWIATASRLRRLIFLGLAGTALFVSFSRSAWLGLFVAAGVWPLLEKGFVRKAHTMLVATAVFLLLIGAGFVLLQTNQGFKNAILHVNDQSTAPQTSNEGRLAALGSGIGDVLKEPLGRGPGTAGPASMLVDATPARNSENYFLSIGQELGWLGLGLFVLILYRIGQALFNQKTQLSRMLLAILGGLVVVNLLSYAWADTTLAYLWWGLAALSLGSTTTDKQKAKYT